MSPEQAEGKPTDKRSDVWSFGVVLYEMLTGKRCFDGKSTSHIMLKLLEQEPDYSKLPDSLPPVLREVLERCLQKDPANRLRDIGDVRVMLRSVAAKPVPLKVQQPAVWHRRLTWFGAIGLVAVLIAGFFFLRPKPTPPAEAVRFEVGGPVNATLSNSLAISPDGRRLAFIASAPGQPPQLWVRSLETLDARPLDGTSAVTGLPFWSSDSRTLVFGVLGKLERIDASGGPAQTLGDFQGTVLGGMWTPDNRIVFGSPGGLQQVAAAGGTPTPVKVGAGVIASPSLLPDGRHFVFGQLTDSPGIYVASLQGKEQPKRLLPDRSFVLYAPSPDPKLGYLLFLRADANPSSGTLMAQAINTGTLALVGEPVPIAEKVGGVSASTTGVLVYGTEGGILAGGVRVPGLIHGQLTWFNRQGKVLSTIGEPGDYRVAALSPDGKQVALEALDGQRDVLDIWIFEFARGTNTRFTFDGQLNGTPLWSPDGKRILYYSARIDTTRGIVEIGWYQKAANGGGDEQLVFKPPISSAPASWSPDGKYISYNETSQPADVWAVDISSGSPDNRKTIRLVNSTFNDIFGRFSPDGKWFAYVSNESGTYEVYVRPFNPESPGGGGKWLVSKGGATEGSAVWRADGKELFYVRPDGTMMSVEVSDSPVFAAQVPKELFKVPTAIMYFDVSSDGKRFLMPVPSAAGVSAPPYKVVLNWTSTLKK